MKYFVVSAKDQSALEKDVELFLDRGWRLQGGLSVVMTDKGLRFYQAVFFDAE